jgi:hypothetical protein
MWCPDDETTYVLQHGDEVEFVRKLCPFEWPIDDCDLDCNECDCATNGKPNKQRKSRKKSSKVRVTLKIIE